MLSNLHQNRILACILGAAAASAVAMLIIVGARAGGTDFRTYLQNLADDQVAAAAVTLGATEGQEETDRSGMAMKAAQQVIAGLDVKSQTTVSIETLKVTVALTAVQPGTKEVTSVTSFAEYVPPDWPANWSWASRQRFSAQPQRQRTAGRFSCLWTECRTSIP
jgi:hypothetical protein